jgi:oligoendopeptidase F
MFKDHQLSDELEKFIHETSVSGRAAWMRLYDETLAALRFPVAGKRLTLSETLNLMSHPKAGQRKAAAQVLGKVLGGNVQLFSLITNTLAKDKEIEDTWRQFPNPIAARNLGNQVEDEVVEALVKAVKASYPDLAHRYYSLKARWFGGKKIDYWDRNAPVPGQVERKYTWSEAKTMVLDAYGRFAPPMAEIAGRFFDGRWIDAPPRPGKDSGAFSHSTVPSAHPYILMNFYGKSRDVMTLAHELGHGVHQVLSAKQGTLMADTPLTTAETASVFGEMLTFRAMLDGEKNAKRRRFLLAGKVEDMLNTVVRQIAFHEFERHVHNERRKGELSAERLGEIWMKIQTDSLGPALRFDKDYRNYWAYIPHFIHSPFYVYAYAFGDCLVNSLYDVFQDGHPAFQAKYLDLLRAGGTKRHKELLAPFGLDAGDPKFWRRGLNVISGFIDELEQVS